MQLLIRFIRHELDRAFTRRLHIYILCMYYMYTIVHVYTDFLAVRCNYNFRSIFKGFYINFSRKISSGNSEYDVRAFTIMVAKVRGEGQKKKIAIFFLNFGKNLRYARGEGGHAWRSSYSFATHGQNAWRSLATRGEGSFRTFFFKLKENHQKSCLISTNLYDRTCCFDHVHIRTIYIYI